jgi:hypothetical protein
LEFFFLLSRCYISERSAAKFGVRRLDGVLHCLSAGAAATGSRRPPAGWNVKSNIEKCKLKNANFKLAEIGGVNLQFAFFNFQFSICFATAERMSTSG